MRNPTYWIGQYLLAAGTMFLLLIVVDLLRGDSLAATWPATLGWSALAAGIFVFSRYRRSCAHCSPPPDKLKPRR
ncbi:hypothetical protein [Massilia niastensis]|uniref:hypothetical protein n=1 Tax=Massilia niastensis TaxID=544911 RepID=UPI000375D0A7|nr:hypothetical protein [Massilia niastensis]